MTDDPVLSAPAGPTRGGRDVRSPTPPRERSVWWAGTVLLVLIAAERVRHHRRSGQGHRRHSLHAVRRGVPGDRGSAWSSPVSGALRSWSGWLDGATRPRPSPRAWSRSSSCARSPSPRSRRPPDGLARLPHVADRTGWRRSLWSARSPGWPYVLSVLYRIGGPDPVFGELANLGFALATGILIYAIARRTIGGVAAAAGLYLWGDLARPGDVRRRTRKRAPLHLALRRLRGPRDACAGSRMGRLDPRRDRLGLAQYVRPTGLVIVPAFLILPFLTDMPCRRAGASALAVLLAFAVVMGPAVAWQHERFGSWTLSTSNFDGFNLLVGLNVAHGGGYNREDVALVGADTTTREFRDRSYQLAIERLRRHPGAVITLAVPKFGMMWGDGTYGPHGRSTRPTGASAGDGDRRAHLPGRLPDRGRPRRGLPGDPPADARTGRADDHPVPRCGRCLRAPARGPAALPRGLRAPVLPACGHDRRLAVRSISAAARGARDAGAATPGSRPAGGAGSAPSASRPIRRSPRSRRCMPGAVGSIGAGGTVRADDGPGHGPSGRKALARCRAFDKTENRGILLLL